MKDYGFIRVAAAVPVMHLADVKANVAEIVAQIAEAKEKSISLLVFPELCLTGYTCADLFAQNLLLEQAEKGISDIIRAIGDDNLTVVVGTPIRINGRLYNCALVIKDGTIQGIVPKIYLPTYNEFYESRWFASGADFLNKSIFETSISYAGCQAVVSPNQLFHIGESTFAVEVCEDLWVPIPPSSYHTLAGADMIVNLSASNEVLMKHNYRKSLVSNQSARTICGYIYCSCGYGESTQDLVFAGSSMIYENGSLMAENERFRMENSMIVADLDIEKLRVLRQKESTYYSVSPDGTKGSDYNSLYSSHDLGASVETDFEAKLYRYVEPHPFIPGGDGEEIDRRAREITSIQVMGLATRLRHINCKTAVIGISGGLDSTLALLITVLAFDKLGWSRDRILGITMPGLGTTERTRNNAVDLMEALGITSREINICPAVSQHFKDIEQDPSVHDVTYENSQARERTQLLMDIANKESGMVIGTGDLSELALGWATYNGDHMSMYGVNASIPKTLVRYLVKWAAVNHFDIKRGGQRSAKDILIDIVDTPISPELTPANEKGEIAQITEDLVGPYELHDFFLYNFFRLGYSPSKILFLAQIAFQGVYDNETILKWLKKFYWRFVSQQFKRSCLPDGPKVGTVSLSPRGDWRMPSDASAALWISDLSD